MVVVGGEIKVKVKISNPGILEKVDVDVDVGEVGEFWRGRVESSASPLFSFASGLGCRSRRAANKRGDSVAG